MPLWNAIHEGAGAMAARQVPRINQGPIRLAYGRSAHPKLVRHLLLVGKPVAHRISATADQFGELLAHLINQCWSATSHRTLPQQSVKCRCLRAHPSLGTL